MERILVEVNIPAFGVKKDIYLSSDMRIEYVCGILKNYLLQEATNEFDARSQMGLCVLPEGKLIPNNLTVAQANIKNGTKLLFY